MIAEIRMIVDILPTTIPLPKWDAHGSGCQVDDGYKKEMHR